MIKGSEVKLGDIADCVTGFYSGDNKKYIVANDTTIRGSKGYATVKIPEVDNDFIRNTDLLNGIKKEKKYIPFLKNAIGTFVKQTEWYIRWDEKTVEEYKNSKTARFQNSKYYFREGIGVPMVKSSKVHAILLEKRLFDQSVVGIFPNDKRHQNYLLAFLNSETCASLLKVINHTANNSANYIKKLPVILDNTAIGKVDLLMENLPIKDSMSSILTEVNCIFRELYKI